MSSWWILPLSIMKCPSASLFMALVLKSILSDIGIATPGVFSCSFAWSIFFQPFTFNLCKSFVLRSVSWRQHMCGSCFLNHSAPLCPLIGAFIHLHLRLLLIGTYSLPFFPFVPVLLFLYFSSSS